MVEHSSRRREHELLDERVKRVGLSTNEHLNSVGTDRLYDTIYSIYKAAHNEKKTKMSTKLHTHMHTKQQARTPL